jgi:hypothetical protein
VSLGRSGDLDLDDQQGQRNCENRIAETLEAVEPALGAMRFPVFVRRFRGIRCVPIVAAPQSLKQPRYQAAFE